MEKNISKQQKALLGLLFKITMVDGKSTEDPCNFPKAAGFITCMGDTGSYLKCRYHLFEARAAFPDIRMFEMGTPDLRFWAGSVPV